MGLLCARQWHRDRSKRFRPYLRYLPAAAHSPGVLRNRHGAGDMQEDCREAWRPDLGRIRCAKRINVLFYLARSARAKYRITPHIGYGWQKLQTSKLGRLRKWEVRFGRNMLWQKNEYIIFIHFSAITYFCLNLFIRCWNLEFQSPRLHPLANAPACTMFD